MRLLLVLVLLLYAPLASADVYRWKDAEGRVHFGSTPPAGVKAERWNPDGRDRIQRAPGTSAPPRPMRRPAAAVAPETPDRIGGLTESEWRAKAAVFQSRIEALEEQIENVDESPSFSSSSTRSSYSRARYAARAQERKKRLEVQLEKAEAELEALEDEARPLGVPPGWLR